MAERWLLVTSKNKPLVPDQVFQEIEGNAVLTENGGKVPIESMVKWGYTLTPVRLIETAKGKGLLWDDERIRNFAINSAMADAMKRIRDEYEQERKEKIFIPVELRGCILSTVQRARNFLVDLLHDIEDKLPASNGIRSEINDWKAEIAEYEAVIGAVVGESGRDARASQEPSGQI